MKKSIEPSVLKFHTKTLIVCTLMLISYIASFGQTKYISFQIARGKTGNGCIGNVFPSLAFTYNNSTFSVGPNFQREKMNFSGIQTDYRYAVAKNYNEKLELFFYANFTYHNSAYITRQNFDIEKSSQPEQNLDYNDFRFKVVEGYGGFGLKINPIKKLNVAMRTGLGVYDTLKKDYNKEMLRCKSGVVLQVQISLIYNFKSW
ncbi:MAG: hypothetical protein IT215_08400 [Chitinophagaceae bacterium]|nr:hypothetical protein [Chitinophagaceae bacterium]